MGFLVNGENVVIEGIHLRQETRSMPMISMFNVSCRSNVTVRNCHFTGTGAILREMYWDWQSPLDIMALQQGESRQT